jgi:predicted transcriptional regulator
MRRPGPPRDIPPPLEMLCLKALWSLGEGNVSEVRGAVAESKPLAYTTVMTVLERLARKNMVSRRKAGRAFVYTPCIARDAMRRLALKEFVDCYFDGSQDKLADFLRFPGRDLSLDGRGAVHEPQIETEGEIDTALL